MGVGVWEMCRDAHERPHFFILFYFSFFGQPRKKKIHSEQHLLLRAVIQNFKKRRGFISFFQTKIPQVCYIPTVECLATRE